VPVSGDVKGRLQAIAAQRQITESALVQQLIEAMVQMTTDAKIAGAAATNGRVRDARLYIRLAPGDRILLSDRVRARVMHNGHLLPVFISNHGANLNPSHRLLAGYLRTSYGHSRIRSRGTNAQAALPIHLVQRFPDTVHRLARPGRAAPGNARPIGVVAVQACGAAVRFVVARAIDRKTLRAISSLILARGSGCQPSGVRLGVFPFWWSA
jgi:hypothetical protein